jgi:hypothetical protein
LKEKFEQGKHQLKPILTPRKNCKSFYFFTHIPHTYPSRQANCFVLWLNHFFSFFSCVTKAKSEGISSLQSFRLLQFSLMLMLSVYISDNIQRERCAWGKTAHQVFYSNITVRNELVRFYGNIRRNSMRSLALCTKTTHNFIPIYSSKNDGEKGERDHQQIEHMGNLIF